MQNMTAADRQRMKDMLSELNDMLERHQRGEDPRFGDMRNWFLSRANADELLEIVAAYGGRSMRIR